MKIGLIYSEKDADLISLFKSYINPLINNKKMEIVSENAECVLLFFSPELVNDIFCYQQFVTAKYHKRKMSQVLLKFPDCSGNRSFREMNDLVIGSGKNIPSAGNYIYNADGTFRRRYGSLDAAWISVVNSMQSLIETSGESTWSNNLYWKQ